MNHDDTTHEPQESPPRVPRGRGLPDRSSGSRNVRGDAGSSAPATSEDDHGSVLGSGLDDVGDPEVVDRIASIVLARVEQNLHVHLNELDQLAPETVEQLRILRESAPEVYQMWVRTTEQKLNDDSINGRRLVRQPYRLASLGQILGLVAVLGVLVLAGYAVHAGSPILAGVLGVVDIIGLAAVFNGNNNSRERRERAR
ncbi:hypothetical protein [Gordonia crocea]|nr:hypothetical protein [Gordonia crocea]